MPPSNNRISILLTRGGRTWQAFSTDVPDGEYHVSCRVQLGEAPEFSVTPLSSPSWIDQLRLWWERRIVR